MFSIKLILKSGDTFSAISNDSETIARDLSVGEPSTYSDLESKLTAKSGATLSYIEAYDINGVKVYDGKKKKKKP